MGLGGCCPGQEVHRKKMEGGPQGPKTPSLDRHLEPGTPVPCSELGMWGPRKEGAEGTREEGPPLSRRAVC